MRITSKGQVTIPKEIREQAGLLPDTEVEFLVGADGVRIVKSSSPHHRTRGQKLADRLRESGRRAGLSRMTTDEIMALMRGDD